MVSKNKIYDVLSEGVTKTEKNYFLKKVGEYGTISKLSRYGIDAFLTNGNKPIADIIATKSNRSVSIQVKTTKTDEFTTGFFQKYCDNSKPYPDFWVFVQSSVVGDGVYKERYFVLRHQEVKLVQWSDLKERRPEVAYYTLEEFMNNHKDGYKVGVGKIKVECIHNFEDKFSEILKSLNSM